ncbi:hypothetical protein PAPHI01_2140 [Pancytospora philotis]|nr:hypothetical protein PAPHI01_2140 [Pancytospora philotis]
MFVKFGEMHCLKRFLNVHKGIVMPFSKLGEHPELRVRNELVHKALKTLESKKYVTKIGNWQHAWYFVTEEGDRMLREEVSLPTEERQDEQEIKN